MQFTFNLLATLVTILPAIGTFAAPAPEMAARAADAAQVDGHIFICTDFDWAGSCENYGFNAGSCSNFPSNYQDNISSVGPDKGWTCTLYVDYNCNDDQGTYVAIAPSFSHLDWGNDAFSSVRCVRS